MLEIIRTGIISRYHDGQLAGNFGIDKIQELIARKYFWPSLRADVKAYITDCNVCLASKAVRYKPYGNMQLILVPTHR